MVMILAGTSGTAQPLIGGLISEPTSLPCASVARPSSDQPSTEKGASGPLRCFWRAVMSATAGTEFENDTAVVVFGRDEAGRPRASAFGQSEAELAIKVAGLMGMQVLRLDNDEQRALAAKLPRGRIFASGRAFVPFVKAGLFEAL